MLHRLEGVQYLRAAAALLILVFHACEQRRMHFGIGQARVDVFFVISGFVMWASTHGRSLTFGDYMSRRIKRLVPLYWLMMFITCAAMAIRPYYFYGVTFSVPSLIRSLLFIPYRTEDGHNWPLMIQGWTLNIEMFFYLVFGCVLLVPARLRLAAATLILGGLGGGGVLFNPDHALADMWMHPLLLEILGGIWLGYAGSRGLLKHRRLGFVLIALAMAGFAAHHFSGMSAYTDLRFIYLGVPALALLAGVVMIEMDGGLPSLPWLAYLGDASYAIYIFHGLPIIILGALLNRLSLGLYFEMPVLAAVSLAVSLLAYRWIDKPLNDRLMRKK